jgi:hypothetical protein
VVTLRSSLAVYLKMSFGIWKGGGCISLHMTHPDIFAPDPSVSWGCPLRSLRLPWRGFHNAAFGLQAGRDLVPRVRRVSGYSQKIWIRLVPSSGKRWGNRAPHTRCSSVYSRAPDSRAWGLPILGFSMKDLAHWGPRWSIPRQISCPRCFAQVKRCRRPLQHDKIG